MNCIGQHLQMASPMVKNGSYHALFLASVITLNAQNKLDLSLLHGDGSNTIAKKGAWYRLPGHKHQKGEK